MGQDLFGVTLQLAQIFSTIASNLAIIGIFLLLKDYLKKS